MFWISPGVVRRRRTAHDDEAGQAQRLNQMFRRHVRHDAGPVLCAPAGAVVAQRMRQCRRSAGRPDGSSFRLEACAHCQTARPPTLSAQTIALNAVPLPFSRLLRRYEQDRGRPHQAAIQAKQHTGQAVQRGKWNTRPAKTTKGPGLGSRKADETVENRLSVTSSENILLRGSVAASRLLDECVLPDLIVRVFERPLENPSTDPILELILSTASIFLMDSPAFITNP